MTDNIHTQIHDPELRAAYLRGMAREMLAIRDADPSEGVFDPEYAELSERLAEAVLAEATD